MDIMLLLLLYSDTHGLMGIYLVCCWRKLSCLCGKKKTETIVFLPQNSEEEDYYFLASACCGVLVS